MQAFLNKDVIVITALRLTHVWPQLMSLGSLAKIRAVSSCWNAMVIVVSDRSVSSWMCWTWAESVEIVNGVLDMTIG